LVDALLPLYGGRRRERKKKNLPGVGGFPVGLDLPCWLCCSLQLLGAIKG
jgi:hypothetical protein